MGYLNVTCISVHVKNPYGLSKQLLIRVITTAFEKQSPGKQKYRVARLKAKYSKSNINIYDTVSSSAEINKKKIL